MGCHREPGRGRPAAGGAESPVVETRTSFELLCHPVLLSGGKGGVPPGVTCKDGGNVQVRAVCCVDHVVVLIMLLTSKDDA